MTQSIRKITYACLGLSLAYVGAYCYARSAWAATWDKDGQTYVHFPASPIAVYYLFRPLTVSDARLTGMRFHIGPHR